MYSSRLNVRQPREVQAFALVLGDQPVIDALHRPTGGQPKHEVGFGAQPRLD